MPKSLSATSRRHLLIGGLALFCIPGHAWSDDHAAPQTVVQALVDAMAENDGAGITALFAQEARQAYGTGSPRSGDAFRAWLQSDIINARGRLEEAELTADGPAVIATGTYRNANGYVSAADFLFVVEDGLITSWTIR